jgi:hypothetical protein
MIRRFEHHTDFYKEDLKNLKDAFEYLGIKDKIEHIKGQKPFYRILRRISHLEMQDIRKALATPKIKQKAPKTITGFSGCLVTGINLKFTGK